MEFPLSPKAADQFRDFCTLLIANNPALLDRHQKEAELIALHPSEGIWSIARTAGATTLRLDRFPEPLRGVGPMRSMDDAERLAGQHVDPPRARIEFLPHHWFRGLTRTWARGARRDSTRKDFTLAIQKTQRSVALQMVEEAQARWRWRHVRIAAALGTVPWSRVASIPGSTSAQTSALPDQEHAPVRLERGTWKGWMSTPHVR